MLNSWSEKETQYKRISQTLQIVIIKCLGITQHYKKLVVAKKFYHL